MENSPKDLGRGLLPDNFDPFQEETAIMAESEERPDIDRSLVPEELKASERAMTRTVSAQENQTKSKLEPMPGLVRFESSQPSQMNQESAVVAGNDLF